MKKLPTDLKILKAIYEKYYEEFANYSKGKIERATKILVPIDIKAISSEMDVDPDIIFGRLYYHMNTKYRHKQDDGSLVEFFALKAKDDIHCVNFPYLASILADLDDKDTKYTNTLIASAISIFIALASFFMSLIYTPNP
jgi:hypothetical protein